MYDDWLAGELGVTVLDEWPEGDSWGEYDHETKTIYLRPDLAPIQRRSTLAHELGHAVYGHVGSTRTQERQADEFGALFQIRLCDLLKACKAVECPQGVAAELGVMPSDVETYWALLKGLLE